ncbi:MAG: CoA transferase [Chloroflexales bacterium]|nr:CoA transferase [Chloroflexales bacterium]
MEPQSLPLSGIRVLEFGHAVLGPTCGLVLADLGAEVIKIERPHDGDDTRRLAGFGMGYFPFFNRNKKSLAVDIKTARGRKLIYRLARGADVLVENFAPGTMDRLGYSYTALAELNPALIYCALKGFLDGPYARRLALDEVVQMMSGLAYMTGPPGQPLRAGASLIDIMGGVYGALGVLAALRERDTTGLGQLVQSALFETAAFVMGHHMAYAALAGAPVPPMPARVSAWAVYRTFATGDDDQVFVGVTSDKQWRRFCQTFGRPDLLADPRLVNNAERVAARDWLLPELERMLAALSTAEVLHRCAEAELPFALVARPEDLFDDPHLRASGGLLETNLPGGEQIGLPRLPLALGSHELALRLHPPVVGEHTWPLLAELGYSEAELSNLQEDGVITMAAPRIARERSA